MLSGKHTRGLCVTLRKPLRPQRLNFKSPKVQPRFTAEDAEDFAKARRGLRSKRVSSRYLPVVDALGCFAWNAFTYAMFRAKGAKETTPQIKSQINSLL